MILATNDDGVDAPGLAALSAALRDAGLEHVTFGDELGWTGAGTALAFPGCAPSVRDAGGGVWRFRQTTPALMVATAFSGLAGRAPGAVIAGVNHGPNVGGMIRFSGTVGAALTAGSFGVPAVAVNCDDVYSTGGIEDGPLHLGLAARLGVLVADVAIRLGPGTVLNVNVPNVPPEAVRGVQTATPAHVRPLVSVDARGAIRWCTATADGPPDSETALLRDGYASVTSMSPDTDLGLLADCIAEIRSPSGWFVRCGEQTDEGRS